MRVVRYTPADEVLGDIASDALIELKRTETLNGENFLSITTTQVLNREERLLTKDGMGVWREYVVTGIDEQHANGDRPFGTYYATWSLMHDLAVTVVDAMPGTQNPVQASVALTAALSGTNRWSTGTVTQTTTGGASMYYVSGWEALGILVDTWGGELAAQISVSGVGVVSRRVALYSQMGKENPTRRFEYGRDATDIRRKVEDSPVACRVLPRGKGEESGGGYGRKITIESVNGGRNYLQDSVTANIYRLPDGSGGWEYPTVIIENGDCETPSELKTWAQSVMEQYTRPKVTYEAGVVQLAAAGMDITGVALGDTVQCIDKGFGDAGLRVTGRVVQMVTNMLDETDVKVKLGYLSESIADRFRMLQSTLSRVKATAENMNGGNLSTADYLNRLLNMLNTEINATGGWTYITEGHGLRTYDREVTDPLVGSEATAVVEIKGGTIRIANTKTSSGDWNWRTVFTSGHIAADMVTAAELTAGYIGSAQSGNYWNLDTGEVRMASVTAEAVDAAESAAKTEVSNVQVGGTNLLLDSNHSALAKKASDANRFWSIKEGASTNTIISLSASARPVGGASYAANIAIKPNMQDKYSGIAYYANKGVKMLEGQKYTVSCWARRSGGTADVKFQYGQKSYKASKKLALTTEWKRYSFTFTFKQSDVGGTSGARVYFYAFASSTYSSTVQIAGMKLEIGTKATDWSTAPEDTEVSVATAVADAKKYTNAITKLDRDYTDSQRKALDDSLTQQKIAQRLFRYNPSTGRYAVQGVVIKNGQLYINGNYIQTNTLNAGIIKTGLLMDKMGKTKLNLETGYMYTRNAELENCNVTGWLTSGYTNKAQFNNGTIRFFNDKKNALTIDGALKFRDGNYGARVTFPKYLVFRGPDLAVDDRTTGNGTIGDTLSLKVLIPTAPGSSGTRKPNAANNNDWPKLNPGTWNWENPTWRCLTLQFVNGICTCASLSATG